MNLIEEAKQLFGDEPRPEHFTNYKHCCECAEHDETLRAFNPDTLTTEQLSPAWDPLCFISNEGFRYYFPALTRLVIEGTGDTYFVDQFLFHLELDGYQNPRYQSFSPQQREFVVRVLEYLLENRSAEIEECLDTDSLFRAIEIWSSTDTT